MNTNELESVQSVKSVANFPTFEQWIGIVPKPGDLAHYRRRNFYDYYKIKFEIALGARPSAICEIGVRWGYSAFSFLSAAPAAAYTGFDIVEGTHGGVRGTDTFAYVRDFLEKHFPQARIELRHADTRLLTELPCGPFDFVHVDGDHSEAGCAHDLCLAMDALEPGGTILVDDYHYIAGVQRAADVFCDDRAADIAEKIVRDSLRGELLIVKGEK